MFEVRGKVVLFVCPMLTLWLSWIKDVLHDHVLVGGAVFTGREGHICIFHKIIYEVCI